jgi:hypothetical protein
MAPVADFKESFEMGWKMAVVCATSPEPRLDDLVDKELLPLSQLGA